MWATWLNIVDWGYFKIQTLQEILKTRIRRLAEFCAFLYRSVGCARSKRQCRTALLIQKSHRWMLVCVWTVFLRLTYGMWSLKCWEWPKEYQNQPKHAHRKPVLRPKSHPRLNKCWIRCVDQSNTDQVPSNAHLSEEESQLYIFEDNEAVFKNDHQRQKSDDETCFPHPPSCSGPVIWQNQPGPKSPNQVSRIQKPTRRHFSKRQFHAWWVAQLVASLWYHERHHIFLQPLFLSAGKQSEMSKRSQESSSPGSPMVKAKACCLVSRQCVSVGQDYSSNPQSPGSIRDSQVRPWEERNEKSGWYSVQHASGNREYTRKVVQNIKNQPRHDENISEISVNSEKMHLSIWTRFMASSMQAALHMDPSYEKNLELFKNSEFENIKVLFGITRMMIEGNSEIMNVFPADVASSLWEKHVLLKEKAIKLTKARVYVCSDSVLCLGKQNGPEDAIRRWNDQVPTLKSYLQSFARMRWRSDWLRVDNFPRSQSSGYSPQNSSRPTRKEHQTWKIQWSNHLHVNVQWLWTGKER